MVLGVFDDYFEVVEVHVWSVRIWQGAPSNFGVKAGWKNWCSRWYEQRNTSFCFDLGSVWSHLIVCNFEFESQDMAKSGKGFLIYPLQMQFLFLTQSQVLFKWSICINSFVAHPSIGFNSSVVPQATVAVGALAALAASGVKRTTRRAQAGWSFERITWKCDIVIWVICIYCTYMFLDGGIPWWNRESMICFLDMKDF